MVAGVVANSGGRPLLYTESPAHAVGWMVQQEARGGLMDPHCYVETRHLCAPLLTSLGHQKGTGTSCCGAGAESPVMGLQEGRYGVGLGAHSKRLGCGLGASLPHWCCRRKFLRRIRAFTSHRLSQCNLFLPGSKSPR